MKNINMMKKIAVDVMMGIAIALEFLSLPILIHEIVGISLLVLIIMHIRLNKNYFKAIPKGKYTLKRTVDLFIHMGLLICLLTTIISGILSSQKSFKGLKIANRNISQIHKSSSIFSLIFLGMHLLTTRKKLLRQLKKLH